MNGRVYDHRLGCFLSVDPFIHFPANSQSLNLYSYIMNNPMAGTDPTGYIINNKRRFLVAGESCMGDADCERGQTMSGPVKNLRDTVEAGGAQAGTWSGFEAKQEIRKTQNKAKGSVVILPVVQDDDTCDDDIQPAVVDPAYGVQVANSR